MLLTATIITVLVLSGLSFLFDKRPSEEEETRGKDFREETKVEDVSTKTKNQIAETETQTPKNPGEEESLPPATENKVEQKEAVSASEKQPPTAGDVKQDEHPVLETSGKPVEVNEEGNVQAEIRKEASFVQKVKRKPSTKQDSSQKTPTRNFSRDQSPRRSKSRKQGSPRSQSGDKRCPSSSPVSGKCYSYGYTFANQDPCHPFCPRLY